LIFHIANREPDKDSERMALVRTGAGMFLADCGFWATERGFSVLARFAGFP
jgi:hypothetical protein